MEYYAFYLPLLVGVLIGISLSVVFYFRDKPKRDYLKELSRANKLHSVRFACTLRNMLREDSNMELYRQLSYVNGAYKVPNPQKVKNRQEMAVVDKELDNLDDYLSVLELCCFLIETGALSKEKTRNLLGKRLRDIQHNEEVSAYVKEYAEFYENLTRELKNK